MGFSKQEYWSGVPTHFPGGQILGQTVSQVLPARQKQLIWS